MWDRTDETAKLILETTDTGAVPVALDGSLVCFIKPEGASGQSPQNASKYWRGEPQIRRSTLGPDNVRDSAAHAKSILLSTNRPQ